MAESTKSGDFLSDVEIQILIRSGDTDISTLKNLSQVIVTSVKELIDTKIVITESELKVRITSEKELTSVRTVLFTE